MLHGELAPGGQPTTVFIFDGLIAKLTSPRMNKFALKMRRYEMAIDDAWEFEIEALDYINHLAGKYGIPIEVVTWQPHGFARALQERFESMDVSVQRTKSEIYRHISPTIATDNEINMVYDPDPDHRFGYGYKARDFNTGLL